MPFEVVILPRQTSLPSGDRFEFKRPESSGSGEQYIAAKIDDWFTPRLPTFLGVAWPCRTRVQKHTHTSILSASFLMRSLFMSFTKSTFVSFASFSSSSCLYSSLRRRLRSPPLSCYVFEAFRPFASIDSIGYKC